MNNNELLQNLTETMSQHGFRKLASSKNSLDIVLILKRQTIMTNRAIVVVAPTQMPINIHEYLKKVRKSVAFKCRFFPVFWGIGIQVVVISDGISKSIFNPMQFVAKVDNQWAIIQSVFFVDPSEKIYYHARTWGQIITGKYQDAISKTLSTYFSFRLDNLGTDNNISAPTGHYCTSQSVRLLAIIKNGLLNSVPSVIG